MNRPSKFSRKQEGNNRENAVRFCHRIPYRLFWPFRCYGAIFFSILFPFLAAGRTQPQEHQVKAAFIFHFAQLVDWPPEALGDDGGPMVFCTTGDDAALSGLEAVVQGKQIGNHPLRVRHVREQDDFRGCLVLFIAGDNTKFVISTLARLKDAPILTVGESENFVADGGMIGLFLQENKIRFDINLKAAQRANLKISSRLLLLAKRVLGDGRQE